MRDRPGWWGMSPTAARMAEWVAARTAARSAPLRAVAAGAAVLVMLTLPACAPRPTLTLGSRGPAVVTLQQRLAQLGYDLGSANGVFGDDTRHAVVAFQKVNALHRNGVVDPGTWAALDRPYIPRAHYNPYVRGQYVTGLEVDLSHQVLYRTYRGAVTGIIDASTGDGRPGLPYSYTPPGSYTIYRINSVGWENGQLGALYKPAYFDGGYAVHGAISVPPYPASHGCVRTTVAARDRLTPWLRVGMPVAVYT